jgi:hypothetical protein
MSTPSVHSTIYSCAWPKIDGSNAERAQSARTFDPALNAVSNIHRPSNDDFSGRPSVLSAQNGVNGSMSGFAGFNPTDYVLLTTGLRQVDYIANKGVSYYNTIENTNLSNFSSQFAGQMCAVYGSGPDSYTSAPKQNNCYGQLNNNTATSVDRQNYMKALNSVYRSGQY